MNKIYTKTNNEIENGFIVLISVIILGALGASIVIATTLLGTSSVRTAASEERGYHAQSLANACVEAGLRLLDDQRQSLVYCTSISTTTMNFNLGRGSCSVSYVWDNPADPVECFVQATATIAGESIHPSVTKRSKAVVRMPILGTLEGGVFPNPTGGSYPWNYIFTVPSGATFANHNITTEDDSSPINKPANIVFRVERATLVEDAPNLVTPVLRMRNNAMDGPGVMGQVGDRIRLDGQGFLATDTSAAILFNNLSTGQSCTPVGGNFSGCAFDIPASTAGFKDVLADPNTGANSAKQRFEVIPKIRITANSCSANPPSVTLEGSGFAASSVVTILWNHTDTNTIVTSNSTGGFTGLNFTLPSAVAGFKRIGACDASNNCALNFAGVPPSGTGNLKFHFPAFIESPC